MTNGRYANVWDALVDASQEAEHLRLKSTIMLALSRAVASWNLPQAKAAKRLQITQPRLDDLLEGKIDQFSLDALVNLLANADLRLEGQIVMCGVS